MNPSADPYKAALMSEPVARLRKTPLSKLMGVQIVGTGSFVPDNVITNEDLISLGCDAEWIIQRTGIRERRHVPKGMSTSHMATEAAKDVSNRPT